MSNLSLRKKAVLEAVVTRFIEKPEPVGSKALVDCGDFGCGSATLRNELNELEREGYLTHVYASSGRVPTDKGYRFYVDTLVQSHPVDLDKENPILSAHIRVFGQNIVSMLSRLNGVVSEVLGHTTIMATPELVTETLKIVRLISIDLNRVLVVLMDTIGVNCEFLLQLQDKFQQEDLDRISRLLTDKMQGRVLSQVSRDDFVQWVAELPEFRGVCDALYAEIFRFKNLRREEDCMSVAGMSRMLRTPEFQDMALAQQVVSTLEEGKLLMGILSAYVSRRAPAVVIGEETGIPALKECGLILAPFRSAHDRTGVLGVIGPKRMAYGSLVPMLQNITALIDRELAQRLPVNPV